MEVYAELKTRIYSLICWLRRRLPALMEQRKMRRLVEAHFRLTNEEPLCEERRRLYRGLRWSLRSVSLWRLGLWDRAQGLPHEWCVGNALDTARHYREAERHGEPYHGKVEALKAMPFDAVLDTVIVVDGRLRRGRKCCQETRWSVDDGCMRSLAYAVDGRPQIQAYVGGLGGRARGSV